ncbi:hypothetical protein C8J56DRAFT_969651 [Mycena floridula]|nr:hypothetical protein C8J56DRAFT_969651 [Mycena floridula]
MLLSRLSLAFLVISFVSAVPVPSGNRWATPDHIDDGFKEYYGNFNDFGTPKRDPTASPSSRQSTPQYSSPGPSTHRQDKGKAVESSPTAESSSRQRKSTTPYSSRKRKPSVEPSSSKRKASTSPSQLSPAQYPATYVAAFVQYYAAVLTCINRPQSYDFRSPSPFAQTPARNPSNSLAKLSSKAQGKQVDRSTPSEKKDSSQPKVYCKYPGCLKSFANNANMKRHYRNHGSEKKFTRNGNMLAHQKTHDPESEKKPYSCPDCGKGFGNRDNMKRHFKEFHDPESEWQSHSCPVCGKEFKRKEHMRGHASTHGSASKDPKK